MTSNLVLRVNALFKNFKKRINKEKVYYIEVIIFMVEKNYLDGDLRLNNTH